MINVRKFHQKVGMRFSESSFVVITMWVIVLPILNAQPIYADSGAFTCQKGNLTGRSIYQIGYSFPNQLKTNLQDNIITVSFTPKEYGGTTDSAKMKSVIITISTEDEQISHDVTAEGELSVDESWTNSLTLQFVDEQLGIKAEEIVAVRLKITIKFYELGLRSQWGHDCSKEFNISVKSTESITISGFFREIMGSVPWLLIYFSISMGGITIFAYNRRRR